MEKDKSLNGMMDFIEQKIKIGECDTAANNMRKIAEHLVKVIIRESGLEDNKNKSYANYLNIIERFHLVNYVDRKEIFIPIRKFGNKGSHEYQETEKDIVSKVFDKTKIYVNNKFLKNYPEFNIHGVLPEIKKGFSKDTRVEIKKRDDNSYVAEIINAPTQETEYSFFWAVDDKIDFSKGDFEKGGKRFTNRKEEKRYVKVIVTIKNSNNTISGVYDNQLNNNLVAGADDLGALFNSAESFFLDDVVQLRLLDKNSPSIKKLLYETKWFPTISSSGSILPLTFTQYIIDSINRDSLKHTLLASGGGAGKTSSLVWLTKTLLSKPHFYQNKLVIPFFVSATFLTEGVINYIKSRMDPYLQDNTFDMNKEINNRKGKVHYLVLIDALNECPDEGIIEEDIRRLSHVSNTNITFIVSYKEPFFPYRIQNFEKINLLPLEYKIIKETIRDNKVDDKLLELLRYPFFLSTFNELNPQGYSGKMSDAYSLIDYYFKQHIIFSNNGVTISTKDLIDILDNTFPNYCFDLLKLGVMYFDKENEVIKKIRDIGILFIGSGNRVFFKNEIFFDYFCVKKINKLFKEQNKKALTELLEEDLPIGIRRMFAQKLDSENALDSLVNYMFLGNLHVQRTIIGLYETLSKTLNSVNLKGRNLWISDFTKFNSFYKCDFSKSYLNPETFWIHDTHIYYKAGNNYFKAFGEYVSVSDENGLEIYNRNNDKKVYLHSHNKLLKIKKCLGSLLLQTESKVYIISLLNIEALLEENTNDKIIELGENNSNILSLIADSLDINYLFAINNQLIMFINNSLNYPNTALLGVNYISVPVEDVFLPLLIEIDNKKIIILIKSDNDVNFGLIEETTIANYSFTSFSQMELSDMLCWKILSEVSKTIPEKLELISDKLLMSFAYKVVSVRYYKKNEACFVLFIKDNSFGLGQVDENSNFINDFEFELIEGYKTVDISSSGQVLFQYPEYLLIYDSNTQKINRIVINSTKAYFLDDNNVFIEDSGICKVIDKEGILMWQKTISSVKPCFYAREKDCLIISTFIPGSKRILFFEKNETSNRIQLLMENTLDSDLKEIIVNEKKIMSQNLEYQTDKNSKNDSLYEGTDSEGYSYYRFPDNTLAVWDADDVYCYTIYGSAFDYNESRFQDVRIVSNKISDASRKMIEQYGGVF